MGENNKNKTGESEEDENGDREVKNNTSIEKNETESNVARTNFNQNRYSITGKIENDDLNDGDLNDGDSNDGDLNDDNLNDDYMDDNNPREDFLDDNYLDDEDYEGHQFDEDDFDDEIGILDIDTLNEHMNPFNEFDLDNAIRHNRMIPIPGSEIILRESYPFIRNDMRLAAEIDGVTGRQRLVMERKDPVTKKYTVIDRIECIHTAVVDIKAADLLKIENDYDEYVDFQKKILNIRSSEGIQEIHLSIDEKFKAFKSWVAGIAEAGIEAFKIQSEIETAGKMLYPIVYRLMAFAASVDLNILNKYLRMIERECMYEGIKHKSSLTANVIGILPAIESLYGQKLYEQADELLLEIIDLEPYPYIFFESRYTGSPRYPQIISRDIFQSEGMEYVRKLLDEENINSVIYEEIGNALQKCNKFKDAESFLMKAYSLNQKSIDLLKDLAELYERTKDKIKLLDSYHKMVKLQPTNIQLLRKLSFLYISTWETENYLMAEIFLHKILELDHENEDTLNDIGFICKELGRYRESKEYLELAIKIQPNFSTALTNLGDLYRKLHNLKKAELYNRRALRINPRCSFTWKNLGLLYRDLDDLLNAEKYFRRSLEFEPEDVRVWVYLGDVYVSRRKYQEAEKFYLKALKIDPNFSKAKKSLDNFYKKIQNQPVS